PIYDRARRVMELDSETRILALGDGIGTDVKGAAQEGIDALFVTGGLAADAFGTDVENPDPDALEEWLSVHQMAPRYAIGRLR
ncbi:MAG: HAD hydrolase-like protein, partial [Paracoccus sp. (in: a-proteobacteria)]|nr:HAD hydrolase-like protein [Paracoccus sp. (in: a-proteobacteria)]